MKSSEENAGGVHCIPPVFLCCRHRAKEHAGSSRQKQIRLKMHKKAFQTVYKMIDWNKRERRLGHSGMVEAGAEKGDPATNALAAFPRKHRGWIERIQDHPCKERKKL